MALEILKQIQESFNLAERPTRLVAADPSLRVQALNADEAAHDGFVVGLQIKNGEPTAVVTTVKAASTSLGG